MNECMVCKLQEERNSHHLEFTFPAFPLNPVGCFIKKHYSKFNFGFLNLSKWKIICLLSLCCCLATLHTQKVISRYFWAGAGHVTGRAPDGRRPSSARPERPARPPPWGAATAAGTGTGTRTERSGSCCWTLAAHPPKPSTEPSPTITACLPLAPTSRRCSPPSSPRQPATSSTCVLQTPRARSSTRAWTGRGSAAPAWLC